MIEAMKEIYELSYMSRDDFEDWSKKEGIDIDSIDNHYAFLLGYIGAMAKHALEDERE